MKKFMGPFREETWVKMKNEWGVQNNAYQNKYDNKVLFMRTNSDIDNLYIKQDKGL